MGMPVEVSLRLIAAAKDRAAWEAAHMPPPPAPPADESAPEPEPSGYGLAGGSGTPGREEREGSSEEEPWPPWQKTSI